MRGRSQGRGFVLHVTARRSGAQRCGARCSVVALLLVAASAVHGEAIPTPVDAPYPGIIELDVDATDLDHKIFKVRERIPVASGKVTLLYPQWHLGTHAPADRMLAQFAGLIVSADQRRLEWIRDPLNAYAFQVDVPAGVNLLEAEFEFLSPVQGSQGAVVMSPEMLAVHWESLVLYPAGYYAHGIMVKPSVLLPQNWPFAGALDVTDNGGAALVQESRRGYEDAMLRHLVNLRPWIVQARIGHGVRDRFGNFLFLVSTRSPRSHVTALA